MKEITSRKQDSQTKKQILYSRCLQLKLKHLDNDAIAEALFKEGIGVEEGSELKRRYSSAYIGKVVRNALSEVAADREGYAKEVQVLIEGDLNSLIDTWMPLALGEKEDDEGNILPPSAKAAEIVRKCLVDKSALLGSNEAKKLEVEILTNNALDGFITTLRNFLSESAWEEVMKAIDTASAMNSEYWSEQKALKSADDATIDIEAE